MGFDALAVLPAGISSILLAILIISDLCNVRLKFKATFFAIALTICTTAVLFCVVFLFEFIGLAGVGDPIYVGAVALLIYFGLRFGRKRYGLKHWQLILQGIISVFGCLAIALYVLGRTVRI